MAAKKTKAKATKPDWQFWRVFVVPKDRLLVLSEELKAMTIEEATELGHRLRPFEERDARRHNAETRCDLCLAFVSIRPDMYADDMASDRPFKPGRFPGRGGPALVDRCTGKVESIAGMPTRTVKAKTLSPDGVDLVDVTAGAPVPMAKTLKVKRPSAVDEDDRVKRTAKTAPKDGTARRIIYDQVPEDGWCTVRVLVGALLADKAKAKALLPQGGKATPVKVVKRIRALVRKGWLERVTGDTPTATAAPDSVSTHRVAVTVKPKAKPRVVAAKPKAKRRKR